MSHPVAPSGRGIAFSLAASLLFAVLSGYTTLLRPLDGLAIFAWRMIWTLPGVLLIVHLTRKRQALAELLRRFVREPALWALVPLMAALNAVQLWVFLWAPLNGQTVAVSMGYFLTPLVMVLVGRVLYGERMYRLQCIAVALALLGVLHELWLTRAIAWPTLLVVLGYPPYFVLRRISKMEPVSGFALEMMLIFPVALLLLYLQGEAGWGVACAFLLYAGLRNVTLELNTGLVLLLLLVAFGYYLPNAVLAHMVAQRRESLQNALPDALDLMIVCVEAGLGLDAAMNRAASEIGMRSEALSDELNLLALELRMGVKRELALRNLALRSGVDDISSFVAMLVQADRFGTNVAEALRIQAETMRTHRRLRAEERAAKIPLKLLFPLIFFIFPSLMVVLMGPAMISIYRVLLPTMGGR